MDIWNITRASDKMQSQQVQWKEMWTLIAHLQFYTNYITFFTVIITNYLFSTKITREKEDQPRKNA
jgi:hypothetical protein